VPRGIENALITFLSHLFQTVGWPGVFLGMAIESAAIPLPSEVIMPLAGWLLIQDRGNPVGYVFLAGIVGALGCVTGSLVTYYIGAIGGRPLLLRYGKYIFISEHHIDIADRWFAEKGEITAFVSRLLPVVRTFISVPAGIARMNLLRFVTYTFLGSFLWCTALAAGGYYTGSRWEELRNAMRPFDYPIAAAVVILLIFVFIRGRQGAKGSTHAGAVSPAASAPASTDAASPVGRALVAPAIYPVVRPGNGPTKADAQGSSLGFYRPRREEIGGAASDDGATGTKRAPATRRTAPLVSDAPPPSPPVAPLTPPPSEPVMKPYVPPVIPSQAPTTQAESASTPRKPPTNTDDRRISNDDAFGWFGGQASGNDKKPR